MSFVRFINRWYCCLNQKGWGDEMTSRRHISRPKPHAEKPHLSRRGHTQSEKSTESFLDCDRTPQSGAGTLWRPRQEDLPPQWFDLQTRKARHKTLLSWLHLLVFVGPYSKAYDIQTIDWIEEWCGQYPKLGRLRPLLQFLRFHPNRQESTDNDRHDGRHRSCTLDNNIGIQIIPPHLNPYMSRADDIPAFAIVLVEAM